MKGVRFYLEYPSATEKNKATRKQPGNHEGNVFALFTENPPFIGQHGAEYEGIGAVYFRPNSPVCSTATTHEFLSTHCLRISEAEARQIHPELFKWLDQED